jgi:hypothetical protein
MPAPPSILAKVKKLFRLSESSNENEAATAKELALNLVEKYSITEEELASLDPKEFYGENEKLFVTFGSVLWMQQLAIAVARYFDCQIVQEELALASGEGISQFTHYVYGDDDQVHNTQFVYHAFAKKIDSLVETECLGRGPIFIESYCEGVVESVKWNIEMMGINIPEIKRTLKKEKSMSIPVAGLVKSEKKEEPVDNRRKNIEQGSFIKDIAAYFKGIDDGRNLSLQDILELEAKNRESSQLISGEKTPMQ